MMVTMTTNGVSCPCTRKLCMEGECIRKVSLYPKQLELDSAGGTLIDRELPKSTSSEGSGFREGMSLYVIKSP